MCSRKINLVKKAASVVCHSSYSMTGVHVCYSRSLTIPTLTLSQLARYQFSGAQDVAVFESVFKKVLENKGNL